jgi:UDP-N-acetylmuramoyl-L-alanyl-D-glutamate--2,6-diaminopimelate ligase
MKVSEVLRSTPISSPAVDFEVSGVTHDSRKVRPGDLFVAIEGENFDGRDFAADACRRGAVGVVGHGSPPNGFDAPWLSVDTPREWLGPLAAAAYGHPDRELTMVGVTGTNGKTTVVALLRSVLEAAGRSSAALGTLGLRFAGNAVAGERTTAEASDLFETLRRVADGGGEAVVMEVSSHALDLHRVRGLEFDLAVFTNLSRDHFDYHEDLEDYFSVKKRLFRQLKVGAHSVVNLDDEFGRRLAESLDSPVTYGSGGEVRIEHADLDERGVRAEIRTARGTLDLSSPLLGRFNLENMVAAVAAAEALGLPAEAIVEGVAACGPIKGRMELVSDRWPLPVYIDYAHTDRALSAALASLREFTGRKIMLVFGCGGDRDQGKRRLMGRVAATQADLAVATSDNPRSEDPGEILRQIEEGLREVTAASYRIVPDRRQAIRRAVAEADPGWALLVAGKGHEEMQILGDVRIAFSDRAEIERALEERFGQGNAN